jgi:peptidoglycan/LPS O-acetylase OafA/YrhL
MYGNFQTFPKPTAHPAETRRKPNLEPNFSLFFISYSPILISIAIICGTILTITTFGQDNTSPQYLQSPLNIIYTWFMMLGLLGIFQRFFNKTNPFATYMTKSSFGLYIVHYVVIASFGYMLKVYTSLPIFVIYTTLTLAVFVLSPLIYEILRRIPFIRYCVFGIKK